MTTLVDRDFFHVLFITLGYVDMGYESQKYGFFRLLGNFSETPRESLNHDDDKLLVQKEEPKRVGFEIGIEVSLVGLIFRIVCTFFKLDI